MTLEELLELLTDEQREQIRQRLIIAVMVTLQMVARQHIARLANLLSQVQEIKAIEEKHIEDIKEVEHYDAAGFGNW